MISRPRLLTPALLALVVGAWATDAVAAQAPREVTGQPPLLASNVPDETEGVGVTDRSGVSVPKGMVFRNHANESFELDSVFDGKRPVLLTFNYAACPKLCAYQLSGLVETLSELDSWPVGEKVHVVTVGLDPDETDAEASAFRARLLAEYGKDSAKTGWHFVRGSDEQVKQLAEQVGFGYRYDERRDLYSHAAVAVLLTPEGKVSRYLQGISFEPANLRLSLADTAAGELRSFVEEIALLCFSYDPAAGGFVGEAWNITRGILGFLALLLIGLIVWMARIERRNKPGSAA